MNRFLIITLVIFIMVAVFIYLRIGPFSSTQALESQLKNIIKIHDQVAIQSLALDQPTVDFLLGLPSDTNITNTSDFQGGYKKIGYKVTTVGDKPLHVYMKEDNKSIYHKIFPKWTLYKITIASNGTLSSIREILNEK